MKLGMFLTVQKGMDVTCRKHHKLPRFGPRGLKFENFFATKNFRKIFQRRIGCTKMKPENREKKKNSF